MPTNAKTLTDKAPLNEVVGRRIVAAVLDASCCFILAAVIGGILGFDTHITRSELHEMHNTTSHLLKDAALILAVALAYWGGWELVLRRTPGKALFNLRVVDVAGGPADNRQILIRTALRVIDVLPVAYLLGFLFILATGRRGQRLGDLLGHTQVVVVPG